MALQISGQGHWSHRHRPSSLQITQWGLILAVLLTVALTLWLGQYQHRQIQTPYWVPVAQEGSWESLVP